MGLFRDMKSNLYNAFILKCVLITNISLEHYMLLDNNTKQNKQKTKKKALFERLY